ncbi:MAG: hypothetical protein IIW48_12720 [Clostridia bacterium]|nr:hypothetical protein [Clostridia bacterium]
MGITKDEYFRCLAEMFISGNGVFEDSDDNELWFDVTDINGKDLRTVINKLNSELKEDGLIIEVSIYGMGEGHLWFTDKGLCKISEIKSQKT